MKPSFSTDYTEETPQCSRDGQAVGSCNSFYGSMKINDAIKGKQKDTGMLRFQVSSIVLIKAIKYAAFNRESWARPPHLPPLQTVYNEPIIGSDRPQLVINGPIRPSTR